MYFTTQNESGQAMNKAESKRESGAFTKRIGYTVYRVGVHFSDTSTETAKDKILRLIVNEAAAEKETVNP